MREHIPQQIRGLPVWLTIAVVVLVPFACILIIIDPLWILMFPLALIAGLFSLGMAMAFVMFFLRIGWELVRAVFRMFGRDILFAVTAYRPTVGRLDQARWDALRRRVYERDGYKCQNCSAGGEVHAHHIVPLRANGTNSMTNLITLCRACHMRLHPHMRD
jgi:hypothetical protein